MNVLPRISEKIVKKIESMIVDFIWNSRKPKIPLETLYLNRNDGGLGLVNLRIKDRSLKASWLTIIQEDDFVASLAYHNLNPMLGEDIWVCNLNKKDASELFSGFWGNVYESWIDLNHAEPETANDIMNQFIWYNSFIRINNKTFMYEKAYKEGLKIIAQVVDIEGNFLSCEELCRFFNLTIMEYNALRMAIPKKWKTAVKQNPQFEEKNTNYVFYSNMEKLPSVFYRKINQQETKVTQLTFLWNLKLNLELEQDQMYRIIANVYKVSNFTKFRSFQYKLLHGAIIFNAKLYQWGIKESPLCSNCKIAKEETIHFFVECNFVKELWYEVQTMLKNKYEIDVEINPKNIMFNCLVEKPCHIANFVCILVKTFLYSYRCTNKKLTIQAVNGLIEKCRKFELYNAKKNNKVKEYIRKWEPKRAIDESSRNIYIEEYLENM